MTITSASFTSLLTPANYQFKGFVSIHRIRFVVIEKMSDNWYILFTFAGGMTVVND